MDNNGNLVMTTDFRRVYATMIQEWRGYAETKTILRGDFAALGGFCLRAGCCDLRRNEERAVKAII